MRKLMKKAFTIVELVIVIAVIAILAAVLIPTFSNVIRRANLSADKQAVREMNMALAAWEAENGYAKPADVDSVMNLLGDAGYNTSNWACLAQGYQVYWYKTENRMVLYNAETASIEYPNEYVGTDVMVKVGNEFFVYNATHIKAQQFNMSLNNAINQVSQETISSTKNNITSVATITNAVEGTNTNESTNLTNMQQAISNSVQIQTALASSAQAAYGSNSSDLYYYATREVVSTTSGNAYASLQIAAVGNDANYNLVNSGDITENLYYLTIVNNNGTDEQIKAAQIAAGEYIYNIFDQMTTGKITDNATILIEAGTVLDCSAAEWAPCKTFSGYFGTTDAEKPVHVNGVRLTSATGYAATYQFTGSGSKYFLTGFFGTVYGNTTIENVVFENLTINEPATDYILTQNDVLNNKTSSRNTVGIIGGITDGWDGSYYQEGNVTLRNIAVSNSVTITGSGCAGGLVGYIGSGNTDGDGKAKPITVTIENCHVSANVSSTDTNGVFVGGYGTVGGILGFMCRAGSFTVNVKDCVFNGNATGNAGVGGLMGCNQSGTVYLSGVNDVSNANLSSNATDGAFAMSSSTSSIKIYQNGTFNKSESMELIKTPSQIQNNNE